MTENRHCVMCGRWSAHEWVRVEATYRDGHVETWHYCDRDDCRTSLDRFRDAAAVSDVSWREEVEQGEALSTEEATSS
jgi:hypothetical protein